MTRRERGRQKQGKDLIQRVNREKKGTRKRREAHSRRRGRGGRLCLSDRPPPPTHRPLRALSPRIPRPLLPPPPPIPPGHSPPSPQRHFPKRRPLSSARPVGRRHAGRSRPARPPPPAPVPHPAARRETVRRAFPFRDTFFSTTTTPSLSPPSRANSSHRAFFPLLFPSRSRHADRVAPFDPSKTAAGFAPSRSPVSARPSPLPLFSSQDLSLLFVFPRLPRVRSAEPSRPSPPRRVAPSLRCSSSLSSPSLSFRRPGRPPFSISCGAPLRFPRGCGRAPEPVSPTLPPTTSLLLRHRPLFPRRGSRAASSRCRVVRSPVQRQKRRGWRTASGEERRRGVTFRKARGVAERAFDGYTGKAHLWHGV